MIHHMNQHFKKHIITLEDPIEYLHTNDLSIVQQREVGSDTKKFANGLRSALRQDPDVILVGEMRDLETRSEERRVEQECREESKTEPLKQACHIADLNTVQL